MTNTTLAASSSLEYAGAYIYSLDVLCDVYPDVVNLTNKRVAVAFELAKHWKQLNKRAASGETHGASSSGAGGGMDTFAWTEERVTSAEKAKEMVREEGGPAPME